MNDFDQIVSEIQTYLKHLKSAGCTGVDLDEQSIDIISSWEAGGQRPKKKPQIRIPAQSLSEVFEEFVTCRRCGLAQNRKGSVFGAGPQNAKLMFIGFAPEDGDEQTGQPYTRGQGELLTKIIAAMKLDRDEVYICHAVKCIPCDGRSPSTLEVKACRDHLVLQIEAVRPCMICVLGESAARALLLEDAAIEQMRGKFHVFNGIPVMPVYELAHLLADPSAKRITWEDIQKVMQRLDELL